MGYETRLIVGHRYDCTIGDSKDIFMVPIATFDLKKMCSDKFTNRNSTLFKTPIDFKMREHRLIKEISYNNKTDSGVAEIVYSVNTDKYDDVCCYASVKDVYEELKKYISKEEAEDDYIRYTIIPCMKYLETLVDVNSVIVIHYGY